MATNGNTAFTHASVLSSPLTISNSGISSMRKCPRYYFYRYVLGRVPTEIARAESIAASFGKAFHKGIEVWRNTGDMWKAIDEAVKLYPAEPIEETLRTTEKLKQLLEEYFLYYEDQDQRWYKQLMAEMPFTLKLLDGVLYTGVIDSVMIDTRTDKVIFSDIKTSGRPHNFCDNPNSQFSGYCWAGKEIYGDRFGGLMVDLIGVYKTKPMRAKKGPNKYLQGAGPEDVFFRYMIDRKDWELEMWKEEILDTIENIRARVEKNCWPRWGWCNKCEYLDVCKLSPAEAMEMLNTDAFTNKEEHI